MKATFKEESSSHRGCEKAVSKKHNLHPSTMHQGHFDKRHKHYKCILSAAAHLAKGREQGPQPLWTIHHASRPF
eukprot:1160498-Pelagomonas_calceolata.AAC.16